MPASLLAYLMAGGTSHEVTAALASPATVVTSYHLDSIAGPEMPGGEGQACLGHLLLSGSSHTCSPPACLPYFSPFSQGSGFVHTPPWEGEGREGTGGGVTLWAPMVATGLIHSHMHAARTLYLGFPPLYRLLYLIVLMTR